LSEKIRILIIGATGKIGQQLLTILKNEKYATLCDPFGTYFSNKNGDLEFLDLRDYDTIEKTFEKIKPNVVVNTAALTYPPSCEKNKTLAWKMNTHSVELMVQLCRNINCKMVFISSDQVYSSKNSPIGETDPLNPLNYYAKTKLEAENFVLKLNDYLIIRTAWVNDVETNTMSFISQVLNSLEKNQNFDAPSDYFGHPTYSTNVAEIIIELIFKQISGIFNVTGLTYTDRFSFAKKIAKIFRFNPNLINEISLNNSEIVRPQKINLNLEKIKSKIDTKLLTLDEQLQLMHRKYD
tara:strand:- start:204 stop:1088 length:885 start_codon:yes stop_codon:yes gene_type:complete